VAKAEVVARVEAAAAPVANKPASLNPIAHVLFSFSFQGRSARKGTVSEYWRLEADEE
jgi:hypothetical protein